MSDGSVERSRIEELFLAALEREGSDRIAFLDEACADSPAARAEVESLLAAVDGPGTLPDLTEERPFGGRFPERLGEYRIVRPLGEGGMGVVLLAIREGAGFEQTVALKLIRGRFVDPLLARRLEEERRILALLEHPGIARLVDGGVTDDGQPYYAMEYVRGDDLLTFSDARRLDVDARLRLFIQVCEAVHHAHQQLIVHRDLKPSNILVTPEGMPKLLDFGIAKTLEELASGDATAHWVTPAYASPEQLSGGVVGTRSDVFALGVLLCQLLTGARPYPAGPASAAALVQLRVVSGPRRPSTLATELSTAHRDGASGGGVRSDEDDEGASLPGPAERAALRSTTPARLQRRLRTELDLVVLKALAAEPERRYDSAAALAEDLRRHLEGRPILARPDSVAYRVSKFISRNRPLTAAAVLLLVVLVAGVSGVVWQAREAAVERDRAALEAARAQQVTGLMTDIFRLGDPAQAQGDTIRVSRVLAEGVAKVETTLADDPVLQATLFLELARIHRNLGLLAEAEELGGRTLELRQTHEPRTVAHADVMGFMGLLLRDAGDTDRAVERLEAAIALRDEVLVSPDTALATLLAGLGWEVRAAGDSERAGELFRRAMDIQEAELGPDAPAVGTSMLGLAASFHDQGAFDEAEDLFRTALAPGRAEASPVVATALVNLGMITRIREDHREAAPYLLAGLEMRSELFNADHPDVAEARQEAAVNLTALGRYAEAEELLLRNLEAGWRALDQDHEAIRGAYEGLGAIYHALGRWEQAREYLQVAMASKRRVRGDVHASVVYSLISLGDLMVDAGRYAEAEARFDEALAMGERLGGTRGIYGGLSRHGLGRIALARGDLATADSLVGEVRELFSGLREDHRYRLALGRTEAELAMARGGADDVVARLEAILEAEARVRPTPHPRKGVTQRLLAEAREMRGDAAGAAAAWAAARDEFRALPEQHPERRRVDAAVSSN